MNKFKKYNKYFFILNLILIIFLLLIGFISIFSLPFNNLDNNSSINFNNKRHSSHYKKTNNSITDDDELHGKNIIDLHAASWEAREAEHFSYAYTDLEPYKANEINPTFHSFLIGYKMRWHSGDIILNEQGEWVEDDLDGGSAPENLSEHKMNIYFRKKTDPFSKIVWAKTIYFPSYGENEEVKFSYNKEKNVWLLKDSNPNFFLEPGVEYIPSFRIHHHWKDPTWSDYWGTNVDLLPIKIPSIEDSELEISPTINSASAKTTGYKTASVDYEIDIPSPSVYASPEINSIKVFNGGKEIAEASDTTNPSGTIQVDGLTPGKDYTFELRVDSNAGEVIKKKLNKITTFINPPNKPTINSVKAKSTGTTTAEADYKITIPSSSINQPTEIYSIKLFNEGQEIAEASNTNSSGTIQVDGLAPGKDYTFELRVDSNAGKVKKNSNKITTLLIPAEKPTIDSVVAKSTGYKTASIDYKITIPSSENSEPTIINSIKLFNKEQEIAEASDTTNPSGTIQVDGLTPGKDYTFELRVDSNAGVVTEKTNIITMFVDKIQVLDKSISSPENLVIGGKYRVFVDLKLNRNLINEIENIQFSATNSKGEELINYHPELILDSRVKSNHSCEYRYVFYLDEKEIYKNISLEITLINTEGQNITELSDKFSNVDSITNGKIEYSKDSSFNNFFSFSNSTFVYIFVAIIVLLISIVIFLVIFNLMRLLI